ncbi:response regulator [Pseudanabaena yagii]|uniref:Response regulator transcription factor n=1 Tax=Pseudanabaena yagii GIHE-NHR1 TaxID=2722753 RepID=A0ABX1LR27_9CYAN|nr:response regulator [Pseudanabaena yagii]NMF57279.1 response regulator transcription factor [Pseudanabaena yagii GIHE-NHR1]
MQNSSQLQILIVDDHRLLLNGTIALVRDRFADAEIRSAQTVQEAKQKVEECLPDLVIADLSIPETSGTDAHVEHGLAMLRGWMAEYPYLNLMVQSSNIKALIRLVPEIEAHQGGFTLADKSLSIDVLLTRIEWAIQGLTHTKDLKMGLEIKPEWIEVLTLAFQEGLQDKAIAQAMHKSERMIRHYWSKIQDALEIYPEDGKNIRALTQIRAREKGLLD